jgi:hypothetical protein
MARRSMKKCIRLLFLLLPLAVSGRAVAAEHYGQVFFNGAPVPGATVTAALGEKSFSTVTDRQGFYEFNDLADGEWKIQVEMRGFVPLDSTVKVAPGAPQGHWELNLLTLEQLLAQAQLGNAVSNAGVKPAAEPAQPATAPIESKVRTSASPAKDAAPPIATSKKDETKEAVAAPTVPADEEAEKSADGFLINGSENNAATSQYSLSPAFGNRRPGSKSLYNGGFGAIVDNSVLDARPYALTGLTAAKDAYSRTTLTATFGGPLNIPHLLYHGPNFFVAYQWTRNRDAATDSGLVPTVAERAGELATGTIPVNPQAAALLRLYPLPNVAGNSNIGGYNYQTEVLSDTHADALQSRIGRSIGRRDQLYGGFGFRSARAGSVNLFGFLDTTDTLGIDTNLNWAHRFHFPISSLLTYRFTRFRTEIRPAFENRENLSADAGIAGNDQDAADWGPPGLVFSSGIAPLNDGKSANNRNRTDAYSLSLTANRRRHTFTYGGDFRRQEFDEFSQQNPRGVFTFNGSASGNGAATGSDIEDFLTGIPAVGTLAYGNPDKYMRQSVYDAYFTDDWRVRPELTVNAGLRWDYGEPLSELHGRLVNLDIEPGFTAAVPVLASNPHGALTGANYPRSLVRPDRGGWEPRIGISWRPLPASTLVVRAGYGIYDDTSAYLSAAESMAQQAPLSTSLSVTNASPCAMGATMANVFQRCAGASTDTFAIDPNLRVGYAQDWQLSLQRDLPKALVVTLTYMGIKGTHGMQELLPNTYPVGAASPCALCPAGFVYRTSNGNSTREAGQIQLRRRLRNGATASIDYTFAKSIDDDAQVGAQGHIAAATASSASQPSAAGPAIAQNWLNLRAERGLSTFDQRQLLKVQLQYTSGMGIGGGTLLTGWKAKAFKEWTVLSRISAGSGLPETPDFLTAVPGTGITGTIRPNLTGAPVFQALGGHSLNAAAFSAPSAGQWGATRRDSIAGPDQFSLDGSLSRTFRLHPPYNLDVRADATNLLNHAVFSAWNTALNWNAAAGGTALTPVNNPTFGLPAGVNPMRSIQLTGRLRF